MGVATRSLNKNNMKLHCNLLTLFVLFVSVSLSSSSPQLFRSDADDVKHEEKSDEPKSREGKSLESDIATLKSEAVVAVADIEKSSNSAREGKGIVNEFVKAEPQVPVIAPPNGPTGPAASAPAFTAFSSTNLIATPAVPSKIVESSPMLRNEIVPTIPATATAALQSQVKNAEATRLAPSAPAVLPAYTGPATPVIKFGYSAPAVKKTVVSAQSVPHAPIIPVANHVPILQASNVVHSAPIVHATAYRAPVVHTTSNVHHAPVVQAAPVVNAVHAAPVVHNAPVVHHVPVVHHAPGVHAAPAYHTPVVKGYTESAFPDVPSPYTYTYGVADDYSKATFNAAETGDGNGNAEGSYSVALPDGRIQHVNYKADGYEGYVADVTYEGTAVYPVPTITKASPVSAPQPAYAG